MTNRTSWVLTSMLGLTLSIGYVDDAAAQQMYGGSLGLSQSLSDSKTFADDFSFRNFSTEIRMMIGDRASIGGSIGWNVFHEERDEQTDVPGLPVTASGLQFRTINTVPVLLTGHKYFGAPRQARAYVGVGVGPVYTQRRLDVGVLGLDNSSWDLGVVPEVGFFIPTSGFSEVFLSAKYQFATGDIGADAIYFSIGIMSWPFTF